MTTDEWLFARLLFVPETLRDQGDGSDLMARGFHERQGYSCFAELGDYPPGFSRYFMKKALNSHASRGHHLHQP